MYAMRIMFDMFLFAFWVFSTQKCVAVIFAKFGLACMYTRPLKSLHVRNHGFAHVLHMPNVTGFIYNANHVIMTSSMFAFHLYHIGKRQHYMNTMSSWLASYWHDIGMTSSCSRHICIACVTSSRLHHDVIAIT